MKLWDMNKFLKIGGYDSEKGLHQFIHTEYQQPSLERLANCPNLAERQPLGVSDIHIHVASPWAHHKAPS